MDLSLGRVGEALVVGIVSRPVVMNGIVGSVPLRPWLPAARLQRIQKPWLWMMIMMTCSDGSTPADIGSRGLSFLLFVNFSLDLLQLALPCACLELVGSSSSSSVALYLAGTLSPFECGEGKHRTCQCGEEESILVSPAAVSFRRMKEASGRSSCLRSLPLHFSMAASTIWFALQVR